MNFIIVEGAYRLCEVSHFPPVEHLAILFSRSQVNEFLAHGRHSAGRGDSVGVRFMALARLGEGSGELSKT